MLVDGDHVHLERLSVDPDVCRRWPHFAGYCRHLASGLKDAANRDLDAFLREARGFDAAGRHSFTVWIVGAAEAFSRPQVLIRFLLFKDIVRPALAAWMDEAVSEARPGLWLARLYDYRIPDAREPKDYLEIALAREPANPVAAKDMVSLLIRQAIDNQHELPAYFGDPADDVTALAYAASLLPAVEDQDWATSRRETIDYLSKIAGEAVENAALA
ncbi:hypothetical protein [Gimibacter soli]|uniref:Uncharacterized protein n=1 Tax=Gimibacter soli TaxID=3024400 RepID=A0AAE9XMN5_9PROT|nr:hypothetical protein [Gimibacter soli]WCL52852.1 hypothetical protein PH603_09900 [Gimibacter soli]